VRDVLRTLRQLDRAVVDHVRDRLAGRGLVEEIAAEAEGITAASAKNADVELVFGDLGGGQDLAGGGVVHPAGHADVGRLGSHGAEAETALAEAHAAEAAADVVLGDAGQGELHQAGGEGDVAAPGRLLALAGATA